MKLPSLLPVGLCAGGILLSIEMKNFALLCSRFWILTAFILPAFGTILLRKNWIFTAAVFEAISVGRDSIFGHPSMGGIDRLEAAGAAFIAPIMTAR